MKNDQYFPLEVCFRADDKLSIMMYRIGGVQIMWIYVVLFLHLCAKNNYSKLVVNSMQNPMVNSVQNPVKKNAVEKTSETPMNKGRKPNETQEKRVEEKRNITTVVNNSSNIVGEGKTAAAAVVRVLYSMNDRGNETATPRLDPVLPTFCLRSAHGSSLLIPQVKYPLPTACGNNPTACGELINYHLVHFRTPNETNFRGSALIYVCLFYNI